MDNRVGKKIFIKQVDLIGTLVGGAVVSAVDDPYDTLRMMLISQTQGGTLAVSMNQLLSAVFQDSVDHVYLDKRMVINSPGVSGAGYQPGARVVKFSVPINKAFTYTGINGGSNPVSLTFAMISDSTAVPHPGFTSGTLNIYFTDN